MFKTIQEVKQYLDEYSKKNCSSNCHIIKRESCSYCRIAVLDLIIHKNSESEEVILEMANRL